MYNKNGNTMVEVLGAYKRYGSQPPVLNGLNMTVHKGTIYGLLGPSGCGKTTLLSCLVGRKQLDFGAIKLSCRKLKEVGFMPQELALFQEFTVTEIFQFYGTLYGLEVDETHKRTSDLIKILELPNGKRIVKSLSGGQQRRVSFAVALLHQPKLLILDEPTVGLDPILCHSIWQYLVQLTQVEQKTIIITTHYIEEARQAHVIGLMREGVLLSENSPLELMASQNTDNLEEAFLRLSIMQQHMLDLEQKKGIEYYPNSKPNSVRSPFTHTSWFNRNRFSAQLLKNVRWVQRNIPMMAFLLLLPLIQGFVFSCSFGRDPDNVPVAFVSDELASLGGLDHCDSLTLNLTHNELLECPLPSSLSCQYLKEVARKMNVIVYDDLQSAQLDASQNKVWGVLYMSGNFTPSIIDRLYSGLGTGEENVVEGSISAWIDMSNYIIAHLLKKRISQSIIDLIKSVLRQCQLNPGLANIPIRFNDALFGSNEPIFAHTSLPGFICAFVFYFTFMYTSGAMLMEKLAGLLERSKTAGMTWLEIVSAHLVVQFVIMVCQTAILLLVFYEFYDFPLVGDFSLILALLFIIECTGIAYGFLLAEIFPSDKLVAYAGIGTILSMFLITGILWPYEGAHPIIKAWAKGFPVVAGIDSYSAVAHKGFSIESPVVYNGFISSVAWTAVFSIAFVYLVRTRKGS